MEWATDPAVLDLIADDGPLALDPERREALLDALEGLSPVQQDLVNGVFWEQMPVQNVAFRLGLDPAEARQLLEEAFDAVRSALVQVPEQVGPLPAAGLRSGLVPVPPQGQEDPGVQVR